MSKCLGSLHWPYGRTVIARLRIWANRVKHDILALYLAARDPRVPWYARAVAALVAAYALSPIDLIPDFIPVLGYLDDAILLPLGIVLVVCMVPDDVMADLRQQAEYRLRERTSSVTAAVVIIVVWMLVMACVAWLIIS